ncbi:hypothetical protein R1sor_023223 [Riccia sorocarpa]|uniref:DUF4283 domain-containing protein n=1 Tax=Riccia sorocarpa TaxID=122646 RepID=A0ABD3GM30_9MARC
MWIELPNLDPLLLGHGTKMLQTLGQVLYHSVTTTAEMRYAHIRACIMRMDVDNLPEAVVIDLPWGGHNQPAPGKDPRTPSKIQPTNLNRKWKPKDNATTSDISTLNPFQALQTEEDPPLPQGVVPNGNQQGSEQPRGKWKPERKGDEGGSALDGTWDLNQQVNGSPIPQEQPGVPTSIALESVATQSSEGDGSNAVTQILFSSTALIESPPDPTIIAKKRLMQNREISPQEEILKIEDSFTRDRRTAKVNCGDPNYLPEEGEIRLQQIRDSKIDEGGGSGTANLCTLETTDAAVQCPSQR